MDFEMFRQKVTLASEFLFSVCPDDNPKEYEVLEAARSADLPIMHGSDSFIVDPVRSAVYFGAYPWKVRASMSFDQVVQSSWESWKKHQLEMGVSTTM